MKKVILTTTLVVMAASMTACSGMTSMNQEFVMAGSPDGIRAYNDGIIGMARTSKENPEKPSEYMATRIQQEAQITRRALKPSILEGLFGSKGGN